MVDSLSDDPAADRPQTNLAAPASLILGGASFLLPLVAGLPALLVGHRALYAINSSGGRLRGRRFAIAGMLLGGFTTMAAVAAFVVLVFAHLAERSRFVNAQNNLGRIGQAILLFQDTMPDKTFPPGTIFNPTLAPAERLSWIVSILPFLDHGQPIAKKWESINAGIPRERGWRDPANEAARNTAVAPLLCLNHEAGAGPVQPAPTFYVGIAGVGPDAATLRKENDDAGFFGYDRVIQLADVKAGISNTLVALETTADVGPWIAGGFPTVRSLPSAPAPVVGPFGGCHAGGMFALFVDGAVMFESNATDPAIFRNLTRLRRE